jgi:glycosyltransferase involved in cell wall biosynthesis
MTRTGLSIGIAMATYNGSAYVGEQLKSIEQQTRPPDGLVIVDDRSADETADIVTGFLAGTALAWKLHRNSQREGIPRVFETALAMTRKYDVIALCDQDDVWHPEKLARIEEIFATQADVGLVFSEAEVVDATLRHLGWLAALSGDSARRLRVGDGLRVLIRRNIVTGATMAIRSSLLPTLLPIPTSWIHDGWMAVVAAAQRTGIYYIAEPLIKYRQHGQNCVGIEQGNIRSLLARERGQKHVYYQRQLARYAALWERLNQRAGSPASSLSLVKLKVAHLRARQRAAEAGVLLKIALVAGEFLPLRYFRFSNGFASVARELCVW